MNDLFAYLVCRNDGQDVAEYAVMSATILVVIIAIMRLTGTNATAVFSHFGDKLR